jgi:hypothetical protein
VVLVDEAYHPAASGRNTPETPAMLALKTTVRQAASETGFVANPIEATICEDAASKSTSSTTTPSQGRLLAKFIISDDENMLAICKPHRTTIWQTLQFEIKLTNENITLIFANLKIWDDKKHPQIFD